MRAPPATAGSSRAVRPPRSGPATCRSPRPAAGPGRSGIREPRRRRSRGASDAGTGSSIRPPNREAPGVSRPSASCRVRVCGTRGGVKASHCSGRMSWSVATIRTTSADCGTASSGTRRFRHEGVGPMSSGVTDPPPRRRRRASGCRTRAPDPARRFRPPRPGRSTGSARPPRSTPDHPGPEMSGSGSRYQSVVTPAAPPLRNCPAPAW